MTKSEQARADAMGLPLDGGKRIVLIERDRTRAEDWVRQSRAFGGAIRYRLHQRTVSAEGQQERVSVVVAFRAVPGLRG